MRRPQPSSTGKPRGPSPRCQSARSDTSRCDNGSCEVGLRTSCIGRGSITRWRTSRRAHSSRRNPSYPTSVSCNAFLTGSLCPHSQDLGGLPARIPRSAQRLSRFCARSQTPNSCHSKRVATVGCLCHPHWPAPLPPQTPGRHQTPGTKPRVLGLCCFLAGRSFRRRKARFCGDDRANASLLRTGAGITRTCGSSPSNTGPKGNRPAAEGVPASMRRAGPGPSETAGDPCRDREVAGGRIIWGVG